MFRIGDRVVCINAEDSPVVGLEEGKEYVVEALYNSPAQAIPGFNPLLYLDGIPDPIPLNADRFKKVADTVNESDKSLVDRMAPQMPATDMVNLPQHYARFKIEPIRFGVENFGVGVLITKIVKYIMRFDAKNGLEDLLKARRCLDMMIEYVKGNPDWWKAGKDA